MVIVHRVLYRKVCDCPYHVYKIQYNLVMNLGFLGLATLRKEASFEIVI